MKNKKGRLDQILESMPIGATHIEPMIEGDVRYESVFCKRGRLPFSSLVSAARRGWKPNYFNDD